MVAMAVRDVDVCELFIGDEILDPVGQGVAWAVVKSRSTHTASFAG